MFIGHNQLMVVLGNSINWGALTYDGFVPRKSFRKTDDLGVPPGGNLYVLGPSRHGFIKLDGFM